jgi:hypothetical protein
MLLHALAYTLLASAEAPVVESPTPWTAFEPATSLVALSEPGMAGPSIAEPALAQTQKGFSYTYAELNYKSFDSDDADQTFDGFELKGSFEIMLNIFLQASYQKLSDDFDLDRYRFGAGWHLPVGDKLDLFGILSYAKDDVEGPGSEDGIQGEVGGRFWLLEKVELNGEAIWADVDDSAFGVGVGARWYPIDLLSLGFNVETLDSDTTYTLGVRAQL